MIKANIYRTHSCNELCKENINSKARIAGFVENIRDHGGITFIDVRDENGITQVVLRETNLLSGISRECSVSVFGDVVLRDADTINNKISTGEIEIIANSIDVVGKVINPLPFEISESVDVREDIRLKYRYLDLRNKKNHDNIIFRSKIISFLRNQMEKNGFLEIQTPILTASSPEGARDFLVPSRKYKGKFYALPQAPQQFKQLLMVSGFDKYFQIAPCFRDEDARADRSPGEFYQLDFEMAYATQDDVFAITEEVLYNTFKNFSDFEITKPPFKRITYKDSMLKYGTDKPDLRNPLEIIDVSDIFLDCTFAPFKGKIVRAINLPNSSSNPKSFYEQMLKAAEEIGMKGLGYIKVNNDMTYNGPIDKFIPDEQKKLIAQRANLKAGDVLFFISDKPNIVADYAGKIRTELATRMDLIEKSSFKFCFVHDFPMYEIDEDTDNYIFTHNPFSMPQGGLEALNTKNPLDILAYQYDIVVNGIELSSGAVRNHDIETMKKAFEIAGYTEDELKAKFTALYNAFGFGAPPHAGMAPGIDRMVMLLSGEKNIREVIAFPMNSSAQDVLLSAPNDVTEAQLREIHIKIRD